MKNASLFSLYQLFDLLPHIQVIFSFVSVIFRTQLSQNLFLDLDKRVACCIGICIYAEKNHGTIEIQVKNNHCSYLFLTVSGVKHTLVKVNLLLAPQKDLIVFVDQSMCSYSSLFFTCFYVAKKGLRLSMYTEQEHHEADAISEVFVQGIAAAQVFMRHEGKIIIGKRAQSTKTKQISKHIALSESASLFAKPILDVSHNSVSCAHASAIGVVSDLMLFYLQSRGFSKIDAMYHLLHSMISQGTIQNQMLQRALKETIYKGMS